MERSMGDFEARMEAWGEEFGKQMERLGDLQYIQSEKFSKDMEEIADRAAAEADEAAREADDATREADDAAREADEAAERADEAAREADEDAEEAARADHAVQRIAAQLLDDGLIKSTRSYKLKINNKEMSVNGRTITGAQHKKYLRLLEKEMDVQVGKEWVTISHNSK